MKAQQFMENVANSQTTKLEFYWIDVQNAFSSFDDDKIAETAACLVPERRAKIERLRSRNDRLRSLAAGLLLKFRLGTQTAAIKRSRFGKPYLEGGPYFNVSHSGDVVALVVSELAPVGCDVQRKEKISPTLVAKALFHPYEVKRTIEATPEEQERTFYRIWTLKESYVKALGADFAVAAKRFAVDFTPEQNAARLLENNVETNALPLDERFGSNVSPTFYFWDDERRETSLAVCSLAPFDELRQIELDKSSF